MKKLLTIILWTITGALFGAHVAAFIHYLTPINRTELLGLTLAYAWIFGSLSVGLVFSKISFQLAKRIFVEAVAITTFGAAIALMYT